MATKKDYERTAGILKNTFARIDRQKTAFDAVGEATARMIVTEIAKDFAAYYDTDNARFDRARFLEACGVK